MSISAFLSHTSADKPFVRRLASDLDNQGIRCWIDEAEIKVGESLIEKIRNGLDAVDYVLVILSPAAVASRWVQREVDVAMNQEIAGTRLKVLPLMYSRCDPPGFLLGKLYADFTDPKGYEAALEKLVRSLGLVFRKSAQHRPQLRNHLGHAVDKALAHALPLLTKPFHRPFQYMGMSIREAAEAVGGIPNPVGNIVVETDECHMLLEAEGNAVNYVDVELKRTAPHSLSQEFDSEAVLGALSINPAELELVRRQTHATLTTIIASGSRSP